MRTIFDEDRAEEDRGVHCLSELDHIFNSTDMIGAGCEDGECELCPFEGTSFYCSPELRDQSHLAEKPLGH